MIIDWVDFYQEFAKVLIKYQYKRKELLEIFKNIYQKTSFKYPFFEKGKSSEYDDVCPFTIFATFNKSIKNDSRIELLEHIKKEFNINSNVPSGFDSIPLMMNLSSWFFAYRDSRNDSDIDNLWMLFKHAIYYADFPTEINEKDFIKSYNIVRMQKMIRWNITMGLYWIRPRFYLNLDSKNRGFLLNNNAYKNIVAQYNDLIIPPTGEEYVKLLKEFKSYFKTESANEKNFIELSHSAYNTSFSLNHETDIEESNARIEGTNYWLMSLGKGSYLWDELYQEELIAVGWDELKDLSQYENRMNIAQDLRRINGDDKIYSNDSLALWQFYKTMKIGDVVYVKKGLHQLIGRGIIKSDYYHDASRKSYLHVRSIKWTNNGEWEHPGQAARKTLTNITQYTDYVNELESLFKNDIEVLSINEEPSHHEMYTEEEFLDDVFMSSEKYESIITTLLMKKNIILQGPPGVGKTYSAKKLAYSFLEEKDHSRVKMIQFHQSYSYEDFVMGYRPTKDGFELKSGPFYDFCIQAKDDIDRDYFFIIDEINRGNLSKIFGELLMLIESDKRDQYLKLMYKDELFTVPRNVYIIGLMNTADRSLAMIDYALRRRFAFIEMEPAFENPNFIKNMTNINDSNFDRLIQQIKFLNKEIKEDDNLGDGFLIGHSYFCVFNDYSIMTLKLIIQHEIIPLLREYWYDDKDKVVLWSNKLLGVIND